MILHRAVSPLQWPDMATRTPAPKARGERARMAILRELRRRELALEPTPTQAELEVALGMLAGTVSYHVGLLRRDGRLTKARRLHLSDVGRELADRPL